MPTCGTPVGLGQNRTRTGRSGAAAALGAVGVVAAVVSGSGAILLDGLFNVCFFATALLTLRVAALLERPDDERYPFGYLFFEPLINPAKGLLILGVSLFALVDAAIALASGGREVVLGPAMAYAAFATVSMSSSRAASRWSVSGHSPSTAQSVGSTAIAAVAYPSADGW